MEHTFQRNIQSLEKMFAFIDDFFEANNIEESVRFSIHLAVEELFTNILKYQTNNMGDVVLRLSLENNKLYVRMIDPDSIPFDITKVEDVQTDEYIRQGKPGGLGIHLVKRVVDDLGYEYSDKTTIITIMKNLEK
jgi:anti-sigma regulatory factor (Ser/Thr protein kinase)